MVKKVQQGHLILASKSPRRRYLLRQAGLDFEVLPSNFDENAVSLESPVDYVQTLARSKAEDIAIRHPQSWVIGADTIVLIDGTILGKPKGQASAQSMLKRLSGQTHQVYTGFAICCRNRGRYITDAVRTDVTFKTLSDEEVEWYTTCEEPFDKAGAYAIQGLGTFLVKRINGSYTNVVGLPVCEVIEILIQENVIRMDNGAPGDHSR